MTIPFEKLKKEWLKSPSFRAEYDRLKPELALALALIQARAEAGMTQGRGKCAPRNPSSPASKAAATRPI
ncbi:MAG: hypothetical protein WBQ17_12695 [Rhizomicrobium sp.]